MKMKLTIKLKSGNKIEMVKRLSDVPKGTDIDTHYMLEAYDLVEKINNNGLHFSISPTQIDNIFIQPKGGTKNEQSSHKSSVQDSGLHSASAGSAL
jgi:hypothetical protein